MSRHPQRPNRRSQSANEQPPLPPAALSAIELAKDYGDAPALSPLTLRVETGERVALIGHNGSGKTTFLRMVAGLLEPSSGTASVGAYPAGTLPARASTSYIADQPTFYDDLSLWEHLEYVARLHGETEWEQNAADLLGHLGLYERADDLPQRFSRGLKQKAAIAIGFVRPFDLLIVDEPFVGLDARGKEAFLELLDDTSERGATVVVATHELSFVRSATRVVALRDGRLVHDGPVTGIDVDALARTEDPAGEHDGERQ